jgi:hypothetical protein
VTKSLGFVRLSTRQLKEVEAPGGGFQMRGYSLVPVESGQDSGSRAS